jgi:hypothetical protein
MAMKNLVHQGTIAWVVLVSAVAFTGGPAYGQATDPRLEKVFADWEQRFKRVNTVSYRLEGTNFTPKGALPLPIMQQPKGKATKELPVKDLNSRIERSLLLDFPTGRIRLEVNEQQFDGETGKERTPLAYKYTYDGIEIKSVANHSRGSQPKVGDPNVMITTGNTKMRAFDSNYWPIFQAHGVIRAHGSWLLPGEFNIKPNKELFHIHGKIIHEGQVCLVIRTYPVNTCYDEFWVDQKRDGAVVRHLQCDQKGPHTDADIQYQQTKGGWLPRSWTLTCRTPTGRIWSQERIKVTELQVEPEIHGADFDIPIEPGMLVKKAHIRPSGGPVTVADLSAETYYRVSESGHPTEVIIDGGAERPRYFASSWWTCTWVALLVGALAGVYWYFRKWKQKGVLFRGHRSSGT